MIASLNIMVKTFAKIAKTFVGLLAMIITIRRRHVLILHLELKYAKMESTQKIGLRALGLQKSQRLKSKSQRSTASSTKSTVMTSAGQRKQLTDADLSN